MAGNSDPHVASYLPEHGSHLGALDMKLNGLAAAGEPSFVTAVSGRRRRP